MSGTCTVQNADCSISNNKITVAYEGSSVGSLELTVSELTLHYSTEPITDLILYSQSGSYKIDSIQGFTGFIAEIPSSLSISVSSSDLTVGMESAFLLNLTL